MALLKILGLLALALVILIPLIERFGPRPDEESLQRMNRWILPLAAGLIVLQMLLHGFA